MQLFAQVGYDKASVNTIVAKAKVSKGAFYYYFDSKEEILNSVLEQYGQRVREIVEEIADNKSLSGLEKFNLAFAKIQQYKAENIDRLLKMSRMMEDSDNKFQSKFIEKLLEYINGPFTRIIKQGVREGDFNTDYPEEMMGSIMYLAIYLKDSTKEFIFNPKKALMNIKTLIRKYNFILDVVNRILGAKKGAVKISTKSIKDIYKIIGKKLSNQ